MIPEIGLLLLCEDARDEVEGKTALLGVWGSVIRFSFGPPATLPTLAAYACVNLGDVPAQVRLSITLPGLDQPIEGTFQVPGRETHGLVTYALTLKARDVPIRSAGTIELRAEVLGPSPSEPSTFLLRTVFLTSAPAT